MFSDVMVALSLGKNIFWKHSAVNRKVVMNTITIDIIFCRQTPPPSSRLMWSCRRSSAVGQLTGIACLFVHQSNSSWSLIIVT